MKKKLMFAAAGVFASAAILAAVFTSSASSLESLRANAFAGGYCTQAANVDCKSDATGNIYTGYKAVSYPDIE
jgi:hypothetical protein